MKKLFKILSIIMIAVIVLQMLPVVAVADTSEFTITPELSAGLTLADGADLTVKGTYSGDMFIFSETKTVSFTANIDQGFEFSEKYSEIFKGDSAYVRIAKENSAVKVTYEAKKGRAVPLSTLKTVNLNASADKLATLFIEIDCDADEISKENWTDATFELKLGSKKYASGEFGGTGRIKGRGNTSWTKSKQKPYSINLDEKASLCDIPKTKKYALITTSLDSSLMRNYIMYKSSLGLDGIAYTVKCEMITVYINNFSYGTYTLCERVAAENTKINIEEATPENIYGGYVIEKNISDKIDFETEAWFKSPYQANVNEDFFTCKDPDEKEVNIQMRNYLEGLMQRLHDSVMGISGEDYTKYIDVDSWVDFAIMQEIAKNVDGNFKTSCFLVKPENSEVLQMSALWDFDYALGNLNTNNAGEFNDGYDCPNADTADGFMIINSSNPWFKALYEKPEFKARLCETYARYKDTVIRDLTDYLYEGSAYIESAVKKDTKWVDANDVAESVKNLKTWIENRIEWLDSQWLEEEENDLPATTTEEKNLLLKAIKLADKWEYTPVGLALEDSFNNAVLLGKELIKADNADVNLVNDTAFEILRLYGIINWEKMSNQTLMLYAQAAEVKGGNFKLDDALEQVSSARKTSDMQEVWFNITDAVYGTKTDKDILDAFLYQYEKVSTKEFSATTVRLLKKAVKSGQEITEKTGVKQSEIDSAIIAIASAINGDAAEIVDRGNIFLDYLPVIIIVASVILIIVVLIIVLCVSHSKKKKKKAKVKDEELTEDTSEDINEEDKK